MVFLKSTIKISTFLLVLLYLSLNTTALASNRKNQNLPQINSCPITIRNFGKIDDCYYRGGQPSIPEFYELSRLGVKTVINLRHPFNFNKEGMLEQKALASKLGMNYINISMFPNRPPDKDQINCLFNIIDDPKNLPVFVHCNKGQTRTGIMTALYRARNYKWNYEQAYGEMKAYGYHPYMFPAQKHFLRQYVNNLNP
jgi:tyrosine-protein phosphatase SIW14